MYNKKLILNFAILILFLVFTLQASCSFFYPRSPYPSTFKDITGLAKILSKQGRMIESIKGVCASRIRFKSTYHQFDCVFLLKDPFKIRIEVIGPFGTPVYYIYLDNTSITCYDSLENTLSFSDTGEAMNEEVYRKIYRLILLIKKTLFFEPFQAELKPCAESRVEGEKGECYRMHGISGYIEALSPGKVAIHFTGENKMEGKIHVIFDKLQNFDNFLFPKSVHIRSDKNVDIQLTLKKLFFNHIIDDKELIIKAPPEARLVPIDLHGIATTFLN